MTVLNWLTMLPAAMLILYVIISRGRYKKDRMNDAPFFFAGDKLVLDVVLRMHAILISDIDHVEISGSSATLPYMLTINVIKKDGKRKTSSYMGYFSPSDIIEMLEKRGIYGEEIQE